MRATRRFPSRGMQPREGFVLADAGDRHARHGSRGCHDRLASAPGKQHPYSRASRCVQPGAGPRRRPSTRLPAERANRQPERGTVLRGASSPWRLAVEPGPVGPGRTVFAADASSWHAAMESTEAPKRIASSIDATSSFKASFDCHAVHDTAGSDSLRATHARESVAARSEGRTGWWP